MVAMVMLSLRPLIKLFTVDCATPLMLESLLMDSPRWSHSWKIRCLTDYLSLCNNQVMLSGRGLQNYHLTVRNRTRFPMTLTQVSDPSYGGTPLELQLNGQPVAPELPLPLAPGDCLDITLALSRWPDSGQTGCVAYCVSPTLRYVYLGLV